MRIIAQETLTNERGDKITETHTENNAKYVLYESLQETGRWARTVFYYETDEAEELRISYKQYKEIALSFEGDPAPIPAPQPRVEEPIIDDSHDENVDGE